MKYWNKKIALSILGFSLCLAIKLKELSLGDLADQVTPRLPGVQQTRIIQPESMNPMSISELMKVSSVKSFGSKWPKKLNEVKLSFTSLPREILASIRKNKKLLDQQKQRVVIHRRKKFTTHTVVLKLANKQKKFRQGNDHKSLSQKWRRNRVRHELQNASSSMIEEGIKK